ncbi:MAG: CAP domain-containing protein [Actinobacteria bacterium]|nr:CAP domain-containing protein [Actinomycetota bacterium]
MVSARALAKPAIVGVVVVVLGSVAASSLPSATAAAHVPSSFRSGVALQRFGSGFHWKKGEKCMMRRINRRRAAHGLRRLRWDKQISYVGRRHANVMARRGGGIWHDARLGRRVTRWRALGQNTGAGGRCRRLFKAFWRSSAHRRNILGHWRFVGVGTNWVRGKGLYVQQVFESSRNPGNIYRYPRS